MTEFTSSFSDSESLTSPETQLRAALGNLLTIAQHQSNMGEILTAGDHLSVSPETENPSGEAATFLVSRTGAFNIVDYDAEKATWRIDEQARGGNDSKTARYISLLEATDSAGAPEITRARLPQRSQPSPSELNAWATRVADSVIVDQRTFWEALGRYANTKVARDFYGRSIPSAQSWKGILAELNDANEDQNKATEYDIPGFRIDRRAH